MWKRYVGSLATWLRWSRTRSQFCERISIKGEASLREYCKLITHLKQIEVSTMKRTNRRKQEKWYNTLCIIGKDCNQTLSRAVRNFMRGKSRVLLKSSLSMILAVGNARHLSNSPKPKLLMDIDRGWPGREVERQ